MNAQGASRLRRPPNRRGRWWSIVAVLLLVGFSAPSLNAMEPWYAGLSIGIQELEVEHTKTVGLVAAPDTDNRASMQATRDRARDRVGILGMVVGRRVPLSESVYLAGELEAVLYPNGGPAGFLPGTGNGDRDVWRGAWNLAKDFGFGGNLKLGYVPAGLDFLGAGRSLYLTTGIHWVDTEINTAHDRCGDAANCPNPVTGNYHDRFTGTAWRGGMGIEFGSQRHRFDVRLSHEIYDKNLRRHQGGMTFATPNLGYDFAVSSWSMTLGYVFGFGP